MFHQTEWHRFLLSGGYSLNQQRVYKGFFFLLVSVNSLFLTSGCKTTHSDSSLPLLIYDGQKIYASDFSKQQQNEIYKDHIRYYETTRTVVTSYVVNRFLDEYAKEKGITPVEARRRLSSPPDQTEKGLLAYYEKIRSDIPYTFDQIRGELARLIQDEYDDNTDQLILNLALWKKGFDFKVPKPVAPKMEIKTEGFASLGPLNAPLEIVEFGDFTCPYCKKLAPILHDLVKEYNGKIRLVWKYYLSHSGEVPEKIAVGAHCLVKTDLFWQYHSYFFRDQMANLFKSPQEIIRALNQTEPENYGRCIADRNVFQEVRKSHEEGYALGVRSTPTLFFNGVRKDIDISREALKKVIDEMLVL